MSRTSITTPCPAPYGSSALPVPVPGRRLSTASLSAVQDDTAHLDYTRAIQVEFKNSKPRRRSTFQKRERKETAVTIFEDVIEDEELVVGSRREFGGSTLLGKPAQRIPGHAMRKMKDGETESQQTSQQSAQAGRRTSFAVQHSNVLRDSETYLPAQRDQTIKGVLKKDPRRRTIFVPADDTTMLTIHPGANTIDSLNDTFQLPNLALQPPGSEREVRTEQPPDVRELAKKSRMSLAGVPKRIPLQHVATKGCNAQNRDVAGQNGGKENVPPRSETSLEEKKAVQHPHPHASYRGGSKVFEPTAASRARQSIATRNAAPFQSAPITISKAPSTQLQTVNTHDIQSNIQAVTSLWPTSPPAQTNAKIRRASVVERLRPAKRHMEAKSVRLQQYPVLPDDIAQPELYEDSWLSHQEIALTELVNHIFAKAHPKFNDRQQGESSLRKLILAVYHQSKVTTLHKRLRASLLYGALSRPREAPVPPNPTLDIGLRRRFLGLWLDSYEAGALGVAAEVVFGRQLPQNQSPVGIAEINDGSLDPHNKRRALIGFLETFLIDVDDVEEPDEERGDDPHARWRKMVLRSLMLIWLLDQSKTSQTIQGCLFKSSSPRKSSVAMLHSLASMLIPSVGDLTRALRHLEYEVSHIQDPLEEVTYRIDNIAVDLRDGVFLTRLVEVLLFSTTRMRSAAATRDATVTIQMPDMTILESAHYGSDCGQVPRVLSQHLKMPCRGRAQKVYNVQVAISTVHDHGGLMDGSPDVSAEDVADGHREKTLSLIWSLVSNYGLDYLVDFKELSADIKCTAAGKFDVQQPFEDCNSFSQMQQESLLKRWASTYAARKGLRISNLTTSFADGKVYAAILEAFAEYMDMAIGSHSASTASCNRLERQLRAFGCSSAFVKQLTSTCGTIPSRKTTTSNLAYLASRLLPLARQHNASVVIQRAFRARRARTIASQRVALMRLAHACAVVVRTQSRLFEAATALQRAWRRVLAARVDRLNKDVVAFQAIARTLIGKRRAEHVGSGGMLDKRSLRVLGGW